MAAALQFTAAHRNFMSGLQTTCRLILHKKIFLTPIANDAKLSEAIESVAWKQFTADQGLLTYLLDIVVTCRKKPKNQGRKTPSPTTLDGDNVVSTVSSSLTMRRMLL
jgi:hypothetical protein